MSAGISNAETIWEMKDHRIDRWLKNELSKPDMTTLKIREAYGKAYSKWDKELNELYKLIMSKLNDNDKKIFRDSQRKWIKFRDAEFKIMAKIFFRGGGTMAYVVYAERKVDIVRKRVITLLGYSDVLDNPL